RSLVRRAACTFCMMMAWPAVPPVMATGWNPSNSKRPSWWPAQAKNSSWVQARWSGMFMVMRLAQSEHRVHQIADREVSVLHHAPDRAVIEDRNPVAHGEQVLEPVA